MRVLKETIRYVVLAAIITCCALAQGCKKQEPIKFIGEDFLYFMNSSNRFKMKPTSTNMSNFYMPLAQFSFLLGQNNMDTMVFNVTNGTAFFPLSIQFDGRVMNKKRKIELSLEGDGAAYCKLPHPDSIYIPANGIEYQLDLKIARPALDDTTKKTVTIKLMQTSDFAPQLHTWSTITYKFGNWFDIPRFYPQLLPNYGDFSVAKIYHMHFAAKRLGVENWKADPNIPTLNTFLKSRNQKEVNFIDLTYGDYYYFLDLVSYLGVNAKSGPVRDAFTAITNKVIAETKKLIIERRNEGKPILDDFGNEIVFPF